MDEMAKPGPFGLDTHINYVPDGAATADYPVQQQPVDRLRVMPAFFYGITPNLVAGLYLPLACG